jgi:hypothetical protein
LEHARLTPGKDVTGEQRECIIIIIIIIIKILLEQYVNFSFQGISYGLLPLASYRKNINKLQFTERIQKY